MSEAHRDNLVVQVRNDDDWAFLELQQEETGLTKELVVVQMIRKARKAYEKPTPMSSAWAPPDAAEIERAHERLSPHQVEFERLAAAQAREAEEQRQREIAEKRARLQAELAELDGDSPVTYGDVAIRVVNELPELPEFDESLLRQPEPDPIRAAIIPSSAAPGSLTGPVGVRRDLKGGDIMGDPRMNVIRRNFKHLGAG